jgi:flagellar assembly protein FliH
LAAGTATPHRIARTDWPIELEVARMILRGVVLSESRFSLEDERAGRHAADSHRTAAFIAREAVRNTEPAVIERIVPAPITLDAVIEWLKLEDVRKQVTAHLAEDLASVYAAARAEGLAAGRAEGLASASVQARSTLEALGSLVSRADLAFEAEVAELSTQCAEVVCTVLGKIAGAVLSTREAALGTVLEVLKRVKEDRDLVIRVSGHDLPAIQESTDEIERACAGRRFTLVADPRVEAGGCIVESSLGSLDGRFDVQLRALAETLRAAKSAGTESA